MRQFEIKIKHFSTSIPHLHFILGFFKYIFLALLVLEMVTFNTIKQHLSIVYA
jgi:hypothetical protein